MLGEPIADWIVGVAAVLVALRTIYVRAIRPVIRAADTLHDVTPTLISIAHEFEPNDGKSLRDVVNRVEGKVEDLDIRLRNVEQATVNRVVEGN